MGDSRASHGNRQSGAFPDGYVQRCSECYYARTVPNRVVPTAFCEKGRWVPPLRPIYTIDQYGEAPLCPYLDPMDLCPCGRAEARCPVCNGVDGDPED